jgi:hypothetical protein
MSAHDHGSAGDPMRDTSSGGDHARLNDAPPVGARPEGAQPGTEAELERLLGDAPLTTTEEAAAWEREKAEAELEALRDKARRAGLVESGVREPGYRYWTRRRPGSLPSVWVAWEDGDVWRWDADENPNARCPSEAPDEAAALRAVLSALASSPTAPATTAQAQPAPAEEPAAGRGEGPREHDFRTGAFYCDQPKCIARRDNLADHDQPCPLLAPAPAEATGRLSLDRHPITPAQMERIEAAGFVPGSENVIGWLVEQAESVAQLRAERTDALRLLATAGITGQDLVAATREALACWRLDQARLREADIAAEANRAEAAAAAQRELADANHELATRGELLRRVSAAAGDSAMMWSEAVARVEAASRRFPGLACPECEETEARARGPRWVTRPDQPGAAYLLVGDELLAWEDNDTRGTYNGGLTFGEDTRIRCTDTAMRRRMLEAAADSRVGESARAAAK